MIESLKASLAFSRGSSACSFVTYLPEYVKEGRSSLARLAKWAGSCLTYLGILELGQARTAHVELAGWILRIQS